MFLNGLPNGLAVVRFPRVGVIELNKRVGAPSIPLWNMANFLRISSFRVVVNNRAESRTFGEHGLYLSTFNDDNDLMWFHIALSAPQNSSLVKRSPPQ